MPKILLSTWPVRVCAGLEKRARPVRITSQPPRSSPGSVVVPYGGGLRHTDWVIRGVESVSTFLPTFATQGKNRDSTIPGFETYNNNNLSSDDNDNNKTYPILNLSYLILDQKSEKTISFGALHTHKGKVRELIPGNCINCAAVGEGTFLQYGYDWHWFCLLLPKGHG